MDDLVAFWRARLDEDERYARGALNDPHNDGNGARVVDGKLAIRPSAMSDRLSLHFVRHDPARVLREVAAKRAILAEHMPIEEDPELIAAFEERFGPYRLKCRTCARAAGASLFPQDWPCPTVRALLAIDSGHPDYEQKWAP